MHGFLLVYCRSQSGDLQAIIHQGLSEFCDEFRLNPLYLVKFMP